MVDSVLAHELAHVRRWDDSVVRLQLLVTALYFFHPVAWLAGSRMRQEAERACDELMLARSGIAPRDYGRSLLAVLRLGLTGVPAGARALSQTNRRLRMRIESIIGSAVRRSRASHPVVVALAFGLLLLPMGSVADGRAGAGDGDPAARGAQRVTLTNPMPGARITSKYGPVIDPFTGAERHHDGIDVAGASYGTVVLVDHGDGVKTFYSHLGRLLVRPGQRVERGDPLGTQGSTGRVTGPHLHFEVWVDGARKNPANLVSD